MLWQIYQFGHNIAQGLILLRDIDRSIADVKPRSIETRNVSIHGSQDASTFSASATNILIYDELLRECSRKAQQILLLQDNLKAECQRAEYWKREYELSAHDTKLKILLMSTRNDVLEQELSLLRDLDNHLVLRPGRVPKKGSANTC